MCCCNLKKRTHNYSEYFEGKTWRNFLFASWWSSGPSLIFTPLLPCTQVFFCTERCKRLAQSVSLWPSNVDISSSLCLDNLCLRFLCFIPPFFLFLFIFLSGQSGKSPVPGAGPCALCPPLGPARQATHASRGGGRAVTAADRRATARHCRRRPHPSSLEKRIKRKERKIKRKMKIKLNKKLNGFFFPPLRKTWADQKRAEEEFWQWRKEAQERKRQSCCEQRPLKPLKRADYTCDGRHRYHAILFFVNMK